ncbi:hypothetical protein BASA81_006781 [Batrachochytrium salamandrivorans]|nr:hypothetical protein BASA81_006781 [Batrachochytrium salamandrivorans]
MFIQRLSFQVFGKHATVVLSGGSDKGSSEFERAARTREVYSLLVSLMPTIQHEYKLRLLCAIEDFSMDNDLSSQRAKGRKIKAMFMHSGAPYEVQNIPSHLATPELDATHHLLRELLVDELSTLPEVMDLLHKVSPTVTVDSVDDDNGSYTDFDNQSVTSSSNNKLQNGNLPIMAKLEHAISNSKARHELVSIILASHPELGYTAKIRFIAAMLQCNKSDSDSDKELLAKKCGKRRAGGTCKRWNRFEWSCSRS